MNLLQELKSKLPAHKSSKGADAKGRRSVSQRGYSARAPQTSYSQPSHRPPDSRVSGEGAGIGSRQPVAQTPAMHSRTPQHFNEAGLPLGGYGLKPPAAISAQSGAAPPPLFPAIAGGIPPQHGMYPNYSVRGSREAPGHLDVPGGPTSAMAMPHDYMYEAKKGGYGNYEAMNSGYGFGGAAMGGVAPAPPAWHEQSFQYPTDAGVGRRLNGVVGAVDVRKSGIGAVGGGVGSRGRHCERVVADALAASLSMSASEVKAALAEGRQPLVRRFLAEGLMPAGEDRNGQVAAKFLKALEQQLPPVLADLASAGGIGGVDSAVEEDVVLVLTTVHWGMLSRSVTVALQSCRLLSSVAALLQQQGGGLGGWSGAGSATAMNRLVWAWLSTRVSPPAGGAIGAVLSMLRQHGVTGQQAGETAGAVAMFMYELSGRGLVSANCFLVTPN